MKKYTRKNKAVSKAVLVQTLLKNKRLENNTQSSYCQYPPTVCNK